MTKTLTEQWREGTLPRGAYYVNRLGEVRIYLVTYEDNKNTHEIYEVLAPVPSYSEYQALKDNCETIHNCYKGANEKIKQLQEQLKEAVDFIEELSDACDLEGILYPQQREKLEAIEKWGVK